MNNSCCCAQDTWTKTIHVSKVRWPISSQGASKLGFLENSIINHINIAYFCVLTPISIPILHYVSINGSDISDKQRS